MREFIFKLVRKSDENERFVKIYDYYIIAVAIISITPLLFRTPSPMFKHIETITVYLLFLDYILRWMTHDYHVGKHSPWAFIAYPFTPLAIMDILGILPTIGLLPSSFMVLRLLRLVKIVQYSKSCTHIANVFKSQQKMLLSVLTIAVTYIFISALIMFLHEPADIFSDFFDALYWATTALTTVGYGDIYPATDIGKFISMISSFFGVAIIAMPASIVTAGFMEALSQDNNKKKGDSNSDNEE